MTAKKIKKWENHIFNTAYILGAGSSCDYAFPDGEELKNTILSQLDNDQIFVNIIKQAKNSLEWIDKFGNFDDKFSEFKNALRESSAPTIDVFIARNPSYLFIGQFITTFALAKWRSYGKSKPSENWLGYYLNKRIGTDIKDFIKKPDCFITFNYDNSLEEEIRKFLKNQEVDQDIKSNANSISYDELPIFHVYGGLGSELSRIRQFLTTKEHENKGFGTIYNASQNIRFINRNKHHDEAAFYKSVLSHAENIVILGYGFDPDNNDIVFGGRKGLNSIHNADIYATAFGFSPEEIEKLTRLRYPKSYDYKNAGDTSPKTVIENLTCEQLLKKHTFARKFFNDE